MAIASSKQAQAPRRATSEPEAAVPEFSKEQEVSAYRDMLLIRRFEE
jgi:TPP-dependent pyruvate/acetoin dehydrogenase alpha subunit